MNFWQTLVVSFLGGCVAAGLSVWLTHTLQSRESKFQKQIQLYGKLWGLSESVREISDTVALGQLNFLYYNIYSQLCDEKLRRNAEKSCNDAVFKWEKAEDRRAEIFSQIFETIGLISVVFSQNDDLDKHIDKCLKISPCRIEDDEKIRDLEELEEWYDEKHKMIGKEIASKVYDPLINLIWFLRTIITQRKTDKKRS